MEQVSRMAAEVNKLIGSTLLAGNAVHFPEVGSLYVIVDQAGNKKIDFSSAAQGTHLVEIIKDRAGCTPEQAAQIYERWIGEVRTATLLKIEGVGDLQSKTFFMNAAFSKQLNQQTTITKTEETMETTPTPTPAPTAAPKKSNKGIIIIIVIILFALAGYFAYNAISKSQAEKARIEAIAKEKAAEQQRVADSIALAQIEAKRLAEAEAAAAQAVTPRYRVVYGVYKLRSNVDVAIKHINGQFGKDRAKEYPFEALTMVSMFESDSRNECQKFLMEYYDLYPDSWIHDSEQ
ncbi:MAG: hypothetical protein R3Y44_04490 [Rikenellaceae bacterium]